MERVEESGPPNPDRRSLSGRWPYRLGERLCWSGSGQARVLNSPFRSP